MVAKFPALNFDINYKYICGRDNFTCQNPSCNAELERWVPGSASNEIHFKKINPEGEDIDSNIVLSCNRCALDEKTKFTSPIQSFTGRLLVITGPMYSQKSTTTRSFYNKHCALSRIFGNTDNHIWVKPKLDDRMLGFTVTHDEDQIMAKTIDAIRPDLYVSSLAGYAIVAIDEAQFFSSRLLYVVQQLLKKGCLVIVNGLKLTARRDLFGVMHHLLAEADEIISLKAICNVCGTVDYATRTKSFDLNSPSVKTGGLEQYYAVCPTCDGGVDEEKFIKESVFQE